MRTKIITTEPENLTITVQEAIKLTGSQINLANLFGVTRRAVKVWGEWLPVERYEQLYGMYCLEKFDPVDGQEFPVKMPQE